MKKILLTVAAVLVTLRLGAGLWLWGYQNQKSNDNIPSKELMAAYCFEKGEAYAAEKLVGYRRNQLTQVWGEPQGALSGFWGEIWEVDDSRYIVIYFRDDGKNGNGIVENVKVCERE